MNCARSFLTCPDVNPWHASSQGREEARQRVKGVEKDCQVLRQETNSETKGTDTAVPPNGTRGNKFRERHNYVSQAKKLAKMLDDVSLSNLSKETELC